MSLNQIFLEHNKIPIPPEYFNASKGIWHVLKNNIPKNVAGVSVCLFAAALYKNSHRLNADYIEEVKEFRAPFHPDSNCYVMCSKVVESLTTCETPFSIPADIFRMILKKLDINELLALDKTARAFHTLIGQERIIKSLAFTRFRAVKCISNIKEQDFKRKVFLKCLEFNKYLFSNFKSTDLVTELLGFLPLNTKELCFPFKIVIDKRNGHSQAQMIFTKKNIKIIEKLKDLEKLDLRCNVPSFLEKTDAFFGDLSKLVQNLPRLKSLTLEGDLLSNAEPKHGNFLSRTIDEVNLIDFHVIKNIDNKLLFITNLQTNHLTIDWSAIYLINTDILPKQMVLTFSHFPLVTLNLNSLTLGDLKIAYKSLFEEMVKVAQANDFPLKLVVNFSKAETIEYVNERKEPDAKRRKLESK